MQIVLNIQTRAKLEELLEELYTRYDLEDLTPEQLIDALLDLGTDLLVAGEAAMPLGRSRLLSYCGDKLQPQPG